MNEFGPHSIWTARVVLRVRLSSVMCYIVQSVARFWFRWNEQAIGAHVSTISPPVDHVARVMYIITACTPVGKPDISAIDHFLARSRDIMRNPRVNEDNPIYRQQFNDAPSTASYACN